MSNRAQYVEALRIERAALNNRVESAAKKRRIADVEAELARFADEPAAPPLEVPEPGPIVKARQRAGQKA
jgi:hypothetical protein